jgi:hypothetical protein
MIVLSLFPDCVDILNILFYWHLSLDAASKIPPEPSFKAKKILNEISGNKKRNTWGQFHQKFLMVQTRVL